MTMNAATELVQGRPLLVAVDFSASCEAALLAGARRAEAARAPLVIVHVVHESGSYPGFYCKNRRHDDVRPINDIAAEMLDCFVQKMRAKHPDRQAIAEAECRLVAGVPERRILELAESLDVQQILVGSGAPGRAAALDLMLGSVGAWLSRHSSIPVQRVAADPVVADTGAGESHRMLGI